MPDDPNVLVWGCLPTLALMISYEDIALNNHTPLYTDLLSLHRDAPSKPALAGIDYFITGIVRMLGVGLQLS